MNAKEPSPSNAARWPSGISFLLYCAGLSLVLLVGYVIFSGKGFDFSANDKGVAFRSALNQGGEATNPAQREEKSAEFQEKFEEVKRAAASTPAEAEMTSDEVATPTPKRKKQNVAAASPADESLVPQPDNGNYFNGRWTGNGSFYVLEQNGTVVALMEMTNGIVTSYAQGTATGRHAQLMATNISGITFPVQIEFDGQRIKLTAMGNQFYLDRG